MQWEHGGRYRVAVQPRHGINVDQVADGLVRYGFVEIAVRGESGGLVVADARWPGASVDLGAELTPSDDWVFPGTIVGATRLRELGTTWVVPVGFVALGALSLLALRRFA